MAPGRYLGIRGSFPSGHVYDLIFLGRISCIGLLCCGAVLFQGCAKNLDYNADTIRKDAQSTLYNDSVEPSKILWQYPNYKLTIQGFCDERGSEEYNPALGDMRARSAKEFLVNCGVSGGQINTVSFGEEMQVCNEHTEACWQQNRRIHITQG